VGKEMRINGARARARVFGRGFNNSVDFLIIIV
jgi:hypothetical protein